jgi:hypothetical protein
MANSDWRIEEASSLCGYTVEWAEPGYFLLSRRNAIYESSDLKPPFRRLAGFPAPLWKRAASRARLVQRLLRFTYYNVLKLADGSLFVAFAREMAVLHNGRFTPLHGLKRPCRILRGGAALHNDGRVYFGEYILNKRRDCEIHLYRYTPGNAAIEHVRTFPVGFTRHVHGVYHDPHSKSLWLCAGDVRHECRVLCSADGFASFGTVGEGDESWRSVGLQFTPDAVYYASDAEFEQNRIFRIDRATGRREAIAEIDGPVYYSSAVGSDLFFAVSAELCPSQQGRSASLWHVDPGGTCRRVAAFEKDRWSVRFFLRGALHFPRGPGLADELLFSGIALRGADNRTFRLRRPPGGSDI